MPVVYPKVKLDNDCVYQIVRQEGTSRYTARTWDPNKRRADLFVGWGHVTYDDAAAATEAFLHALVRCEQCEEFVQPHSATLTGAAADSGEPFVVCDGCLEASEAVGG